MKLVNRLKFTTTATSLASVTSFASVPKFRTLVQAIADGKLTLGQSGLQFLGEDANSWEESYFTVGGTAQNPTLTRDRVSDSSNSGNPVTFSGTVTMACTLLAEDLVGVGVLDLPLVTAAPSGAFVELTLADGTAQRILAANMPASGAPADTTAPTLSSPTSASTGTTTGSGSVTTNEGNGTLYYLTTANTTETAATVKANGATKAVTAAGSIPVTVQGLSAATTYYLHFLHKDAAGNDSAVSNSASFTTAAAGDTTAPTLTSPTSAANGSAAATGSVTTNEANGTLYTYASTNAIESATTVKASGAMQPVTATGVQNVTVSGLSAGTPYYLHFVHRDAAGNDSTVANSASFTTAAGAPAVPYTIASYYGGPGIGAGPVTVSNGSVDTATATLDSYWNINTTNAPVTHAPSAVVGWSNSPTNPPASRSAVAANGQNLTNGYIDAGYNNTAWYIGTLYLYPPLGSSDWYIWFKPVDGDWQCKSRKDGSNNPLPLTINRTA